MQDSEVQDHMKTLINTRNELQGQHRQIPKQLDQSRRRVTSADIMDWGAALRGLESLRMGEQLLISATTHLPPDEELLISHVPVLGMQENKLWQTL